MTNFIKLRKRAVCIIASIALLFTLGDVSAQTAPTLGTVGTFGAFSGAGAITNTGLTLVTGDIGTHVGSFTGFPPGLYTGAKHVADATSLTAKNDLTLAYNSMNDATNAVKFDTALGSTMGNGQVLTPRTYGRGDLTTISGNLTFDAKGNPAAIFIVKIGAALNVSGSTQILLANGARAENIYWAVNGSVSILDNSSFKGTILSNGAIHLYGGTTLEGRALAVIGAVTMASNMVTVPGPDVVADNLVVITPATGDSIKGGTQNYNITWGGTGIGSNKTLDYSLDAGVTWTRIGTVSGDVFSYKWNVPDTVSNTARVRVTDQNNLSGTSGIFRITSSDEPASIVVMRPSQSESITGGTQNYQITWSGSNIGPVKTLEYSLDGGATWMLIGIATGNVFSYDWDVPNTPSGSALVRITDQDNVRGVSGIFSIVSSGPTPSIIVVRPAAGEIIAGGTQNYQIMFTPVNTTMLKRLEYSLDGGSTWTLIGLHNSETPTYSWADVPNVATTQAKIRVTDGNGVSGTSGMFTITMTPGAGSINSLTLTGLDTRNNIGNNQSLGISWTYTPDIGPAVLVEYSLDNMTTWVPVGTVVTSESASTTWMTPPSGSYNPVYIRVTSTSGMTRTSTPFSISSVASVESDLARAGYAVSSYPNPASAQATISFVLPVPSQVTLTITDGLGREVGVVASQQFHAGSHELSINTSKLPVGMYAYTLQAGSARIVGRMNVVR